MYYDYYGQYSYAYDQDTLIDGPVGKAKKDYEAWLTSNPEVHAEINDKIKSNYLFQCDEEYRNKVLSIDLNNIDDASLSKLERLTKMSLIEVEHKHQLVIYDPRNQHNQNRRPHPPQKSPFGYLADVIQETMFDWRPGNSEKEDRNKLMMKLAQLYLVKDVNVFYSGSAAIMYVIQYLYKLRIHWKNQFDASSAQLRNIISNTVNQRFILVNRDRMIEFKEKVLHDCNKMAQIMHGHDFTPIFNSKMTEFYKMFEDANMEMVTNVTNNYVDLAIRQMSQGGIWAQGQVMEEQSQKLFLERAIGECDSNSMSIFKQLSDKYHAQIKEEMEQMMFSAHMMNLQAQPTVSFANL